MTEVPQTVSLRAYASGQHHSNNRDDRMNPGVAKPPWSRTRRATKHRQMWRIIPTPGTDARSAQANHQHLRSSDYLNRVDRTPPLITCHGPGFQARWSRSNACRSQSGLLDAGADGGEAQLWIVAPQASHTPTMGGRQDRPSWRRFRRTHTVQEHGWNVLLKVNERSPDAQGFLRDAGDESSQGQQLIQQFPRPWN